MRNTLYAAFTITLVRRCNHEFEALVSSADEAVECPECQSRRIERQLSMPAKPRSEGDALPWRAIRRRRRAAGVLPDVKWNRWSMFDRRGR